MTTLINAIAGAIRVVGATARGMVLDTVAAVAWLGEAATGKWRATSTHPATLRAHVVILSDEQGKPLVDPGAVAAALRRADAIFRQGAGMRVRQVGVTVVGEPAPTRALDPRSNRRLLLDHVVGHTAHYLDHLPPRSAVTGMGDPVTVVVVRSIAGRTTGCSLGMTADWVICQASLFDASNKRTYDETVLAHELGHALNLPHVKDPANLMSPTSSPPDRIRGTGLRRWQATILQANRHTIPPPDRR